MLQRLNKQKKLHGKPWERKGQNHFDWSYLQQKVLVEQKLLNEPGKAGMVTDPNEIETFNVSNFADVITLLREPVSR